MVDAFDILFVLTLSAELSLLLILFPLTFIDCSKNVVLNDDSYEIQRSAYLSLQSLSLVQSPFLLVLHPLVFEQFI